MTGDERPLLVSEFRLVCGWCGQVMRESHHPGALTSTGMCPSCQHAFESNGLGARPERKAVETVQPMMRIVARSRRWCVTRGTVGIDCHIQRMRDFSETTVYETSVLYDGQPMYSRTFPTRREAEREADELLHDLLAAGWFLPTSG